MVAGPDPGILALKTGLYASSNRHARLEHKCRIQLNSALSKAAV